MNEKPDILEMVDAYKELLDQKEALAAQTKELNKQLEDARRALSQLMIDEEMPRVSRSGYVYSLQDKTKYSRRGGIDDEEFCEMLEGQGLDGIIKRTVDARTLSSTISVLVEDNDGELPEDLEDYISVYQYYDIGKRKETNQTAAKAKNRQED